MLGCHIIDSFIPEAGCCIVDVSQ